ncbi:MAG: helix-turn-helix domain-containing protein [Chthoniobacterales bacterium]
MASTAAGFINQLSRSEIYRDYERAFCLATELPLTLRPPQNWSPALHGHRNENPFCALLAQSSKSCAACLRMQEKIAGLDATCASSETCFAGLCDTAVPVRIGEKLAGFLQTGQVALHPPTAARFDRIARKIIEWGVNVDLRRLEQAYFHSRVLSPEKYAGAVRLLEIFATHLGIVGNQLLVRESASEPPLVRRAKAYVGERSGEAIPLAEISGALHVSTYYFCKMFRKATGLTFTNYLARVRVEKAKALLLDPNRRISEAAFEAGFGSLTHFNRVFRKLAGCSPTAYRGKLPAIAKASRCD